MSLRMPLSDIVMKQTAAAAGTYASGEIANPGQASFVMVWVACTAQAGSTHTLDVAIQTSPDNSTWTSVTGGSIPQLTAAGNASACALIADEYVQILATVGGSVSPTATFSVSVTVIES